MKDLVHDMKCQRDSNESKGFLRQIEIGNAEEGNDDQEKEDHHECRPDHEEKKIILHRNMKPFASPI